MPFSMPRRRIYRRPLATIQKFKNLKILKQLLYYDPRLIIFQYLIMMMNMKMHRAM